MFTLLTIIEPNTTVAEFENSVDLDKTAHNDPSQQDLQCLRLELKVFRKFCRHNFDVCLFGT